MFIILYKGSNKNMRIPKIKVIREKRIIFLLHMKKRITVNIKLNPMQCNTSTAKKDVLKYPENQSKKLILIK
jgi:hypothetical protein